MVLDFIDESQKEQIIGMWKEMSEIDKGHFINQVALALSVWGSDAKGKKLVVEILSLMTTNGTNTLADFGLYVEQAISLKPPPAMTSKIKRAAIIIDGYRIKNSLPSEPHKELF